MDTSSQSSPNYLIDYDFILVPDPRDEQHFTVAIMTGPYEGVSYRYDVIEIVEEKEYAKFVFSYSLLSNSDVVSDSRDFERHAAKILDSLLNDLPEESIRIT